MSDKQLAVYLQNIYRQLFEELENVKAELKTDTEYNKPYKGISGNEVSYFPILQGLSALVENISFDIDALKDNK
jgi:hypothetical protein